MPEALELALSGGHHPLADLGGGLAVVGAGDVAELDGGDFDREIDPIE